MNKDIKKDQTLNYINQAKDEASILINYAALLTKAFDTGTKEELLYALDNNLKLWVEIETSIKNAKNLLPETIKNNIVKLSKFVERVILSKGVSLTKSDVECLTNINIQIASGILEQLNNVMAIEDAISLLQCAINISAAKEKKNKSDLIYALDDNMKLWVYIKTMAQKKDSKLPKETKDNLIKLADYISAKTIEVGRNIDDVNEKDLDSMINTNLQISEGLVTNRVA